FSRFTLIDAVSNCSRSSGDCARLNGPLLISAITAKHLKSTMATSLPKLTIHRKRDDLSRTLEPWIGGARADQCSNSFKALLSHRRRLSHLATIIVPRTAALIFDISWGVLISRPGASSLPAITGRTGEFKSGHISGRLFQPDKTESTGYVFGIF